MSDGPDTLNRFMVTTHPESGLVVILAPPDAGQPLTCAEALSLAAWLLVFADPDAAMHMRPGPVGAGAEFVELLRAVLNS